MLYIGSQTTANGGYASMFSTREYQYDLTLQRLRPPLLPGPRGLLEHLLLEAGAAPRLIGPRRGPRAGTSRP